MNAANKKKFDAAAAAVRKEGFLALTILMPEKMTSEEDFQWALHIPHGMTESVAQSLLVTVGEILKLGQDQSTVN